MVNVELIDVFFTGIHDQVSDDRRRDFLKPPVQLAPDRTFENKIEAGERESQQYSHHRAEQDQHAEAYGNSAAHSATFRQ